MEENNYFVDLRTNNPQRSPMAKIPVSVMTFILLLTVINPASALCIKNEKANLRKGPGIKHEKLWQVFQYMPFKLLGSKGNWNHVQDVDGDTYWVHAPLTTQKYKCAVIKKQSNQPQRRPRHATPHHKMGPRRQIFLHESP